MGATKGEGTAGDDPLRARLRRLRRDGEGPGAGPGAETGARTGPAKTEQPAVPARRRAGGGIPVWLAARLEAQRRRRGAPEEDVPTRVPVEAGAPRDLVETSGVLGPFAARHEQQPGEWRHGAWRLDEVDAVAPDAFAVFGRGELHSLDLRRAVYLDIETTGLSGGAGVVPFLVALGTFTADGRFHLWQGFLREPGEEPAMLAETARRIEAADAVVSFFGKSFDRHRLEDKMRMFGVEPPFEGRPHLDLYHPCARLYRDALPDGRLATMERALCGVEREDDLPGSFAPAAWFDFLRDRAHRLEAVFRHNRDDVFSLVTLAAHLGRVAAETRADGTPLPGPPDARAVGLARLHADRGRRGEALAWVERALGRVVADAGLRPLHLLRADLRKGLGDRAGAATDYTRVAEGAEDGLAVQALVELAKDAEHRLRDPETAATHCARARRVLERACTGRTRERFRRDLDKREARLRARDGGGQKG